VGFVQARLFTARSPPSCFLPSHTSCPPLSRRRYVDMVMRDKNDARNKEAGERGPGGVRMVVERDFRNMDAINRFMREMRAPGSRMYDEVSKMKVGRAAELPGGLDRGSRHPRTSSLEAGAAAYLCPLLPLRLLCRRAPGRRSSCQNGAS
jgi:hypothetical protein